VTTTAKSIRHHIEGERTKNKANQLETLVEMQLTNGEMMRILLDEVCEDGYIGRIVTHKGRSTTKSREPLPENAMLTIRTGRTHVAEHIVGIVQALPINTNTKVA
jgi:hypothetical protein